MSNPGYTSWNQLQDLYKTIGPFYNSSTVSNDYSNNGSADIDFAEQYENKVSSGGFVGPVKPTETTNNNYVKTNASDAFAKILNETAKAADNKVSSGGFVGPVKPTETTNIFLDAALPSNTDKVTTYNAGVEQSKEKEDTSTNFDLDRFESLLSRLEASKGRQQRQKSVEGRRDIFSQGLASMMSNI